MIDWNVVEEEEADGDAAIISDNIAV